MISDHSRRLSLRECKMQGERLIQERGIIVFFVRVRSRWSRTNKSQLCCCAAKKNYLVQRSAFSVQRSLSLA